MKRAYYLLPFVLLLIGIVSLPRAAIANLSLLRLPPALERGQGGTVVGDGTPASCTDTALTQALAGGGEITFNCGPNPHVILLGSQKIITAETSIDGAGLIILSGVNVTRHFFVSQGTILRLHNLTLTAGSVGSGDRGGSIFNNGVLTTENVTFTHNLVASGNGGAGAIYNNGASLISDTRFLDNRATFGGALANTLTGTVTITNSTFLSNTTITPNDVYCRINLLGGGGIHNKGSLSYRGGRMQGNQSMGGIADETCGGALANYGTLSVYDVEIRDNIARLGSALYSVGSATIEQSSLIANRNVMTETGEAISVWNDSNVTAPPLLAIRHSEILSTTGPGVSVGPVEFYLEHSTVAYNTEAGVRFIEPSHAFISNSTLSHNLEGLSVLKSLVPVRVFNSTLMNDITNVSMYYTSTVWLQNTALVGAAPRNCYIWEPVYSWYDLRSDGYNLSDDGSCYLTQTTDYPNTEPLLGVLQDNGGDTLTHLPAVTSPLLEHALCLNFVPDDQRGIPRPQGVACDIGAVERTANEGATPTPTTTATATDTPTPTVTPTGTLTVTPSATPTGTPPTFTERLYLPLIHR